MESPGDSMEETLNSQGKETQYRSIEPASLLRKSIKRRITINPENNILNTANDSLVSHDSMVKDYLYLLSKQ